MRSTNKKSSTQKQKQQHKLKDYLAHEIPIQSIFEEEIEQIQYPSQEVVKYDYIKGNEFLNLKSQGNKIYQNLKQFNSQKNEKSELQQARSYYEAAGKYAQTTNEVSSINKNLAVVNFKEIVINCSPDNNLSLFLKGVVYKNQAIRNGQMAKSKPREWYTELINIQNQALKFILNNILNQKESKKMDLDEAIYHLTSVAFEIKLDIDYEIHLIIWKKIFEVKEEEINFLQKQEEYELAENLYRKYADDLKKMYIQSKKSKKERIKFFYEERYQNQDCGLHIYQAYRYLQLGNKHYKNVQNQKIQNSSFKIEQSEEIWEAVDAYKAAIRLYEGKFLHIEAECYFMIGQIYLEIFGSDDQKVHNYIHNSITLDFNSSQVNKKQWYLEANNLMKQLQKDRTQRKNSILDIWMKQNQPLVDKIKEYENKGYYEFIPWLVKEHLPSHSKDFKLKDDDLSYPKKVLQKVMKLYHADKIINESDHFKNIAKQIMLSLLTMYEKFK